MTHPTPLSTAASAYDLVARLRHGHFDGEVLVSMLNEAADEIERLRQPVAGDASDLVKALEWIEYHYANQDMKHVDFRVGAYDRALNALTRHRQGEKA